MAQYELLAGLHYAAKPGWKPTEKDVEEAKAAGRPVRAPSVRYERGAVIESETDLAAKFGTNKFRKVGDNLPTTLSEIDRQIALLQKRRAKLQAVQDANSGGQEVREGTTSVTPHGQVTEGFQATHAGVSGAADVERLNALLQSKAEAAESNPVIDALPPLHQEPEAPVTAVDEPFSGPGDLSTPRVTVDTPSVPSAPKSPQPKRGRN